MTEVHNAAPFWILRNLAVLLCGTIILIAFVCYESISPVSPPAYI